MYNRTVILPQLRLHKLKRIKMINIERQTCISNNSCYGVFSYYNLGSYSDENMCHPLDKSDERSLLPKWHELLTDLNCCFSDLIWVVAFNEFSCPTPSMAVEVHEKHSEHLFSQFRRWKTST